MLQVSAVSSLLISLSSLSFFPFPIPAPTSCPQKPHGPHMCSKSSLHTCRGCTNLSSFCLFHSPIPVPSSCPYSILPSYPVPGAMPPSLCNSTAPPRCPDNSLCVDLPDGSAMCACKGGFQLNGTLCTGERRTGPRCHLPWKKVVECTRVCMCVCKCVAKRTARSVRRHSSGV